MRTPKIVRALSEAVSGETAFVQPDYPYGRSLRCMRRNWLEYRPKMGFRTMTQTSNPKRGNDWLNKPNASTYSMLSVLTLTDEFMTDVPGTVEGPQPTGVQSWSVDTSNLEQFEAWYSFFRTNLGDDQARVSDNIRTFFDRMLSIGRVKRTGIKFRVLDAFFGEVIEAETTASHPIFAAGVTLSGGSYAEKEVKDLLDKHGCGGYNPPVRYIGPQGHCKTGIFQSYTLGQMLRLEYLSGGDEETS